jgi:cytochrome P450
MSPYPSTEVDLTGKVAPATSHWRELDELREAHAVFWNTHGDGYWVVTRLDEVREAFHQPATFCNRSISPIEPDPVYRMLPSFLEPPVHMRYRHLLNGWFSPGKVAAAAPALDALARAEVETLRPAGGCDYVDSFGARFPAAAMLAYLGLPVGDTDVLLDAVRRRAEIVADVRSRLDPATAASDDRRIMEAWGEIAAYWEPLIADRRVRPRDPDIDFVTSLTGCELDGRPLPPRDVVDILVTLTIGSLGTMRDQLGWCMHHLATHPEDRDRLRVQPELWPGAIEELLRFYAVASMARKATRDVDFHGCPVREGDMLLLDIQAANRDPRVFPDADRVVLDRSPNRHITFGASAHRCMGSHLARLELLTALRQWHAALPDYELATGDTLLARGGQISLLRLPLRWDR